MSFDCVASTVTGPRDREIHHVQSQTRYLSQCPAQGCEGDTCWRLLGNVEEEMFSLGLKGRIVLLTEAGERKLLLQGLTSIKV